MLNTVEKLHSIFCDLSSNEKSSFLRLVNKNNIDNNEIRIVKQKNSIKIWPYLDDISQTIIPYSNEHLSEDINTVVNLDFSRVRRVTSSGAAITLMKLISIFSNKMYLYRLTFPEDQAIERYFQESGFFSIMDEYFNLIKKDLFDIVEINKLVRPYIVFDENKQMKIISFPIFHLRYNTKNDREGVDIFMDWITDIFINYLSNYDFQRNTLLTILKEIAKNSQDHTMSDAYFGFDIIENTMSNNGELFFSFSDLGIGIVNNVRNNGSEYYIRAKEKFSFADAYHFAFTMGKTTSRNPRNKGIGMSMIRDGAEILNLDLTIWDGRSMLFLPGKISHSELRRNTFDTGKSVGFYYYGRLKV